MLSRDEAITKANAYLQAEGSQLIAHFESALPNPLQRLWIVSYIDPTHPDQQLDGGGLVVPTDGEVYEISSAPGGEELLGAQVPETPDRVLPDGWHDALSHVYGEPWWDELMTFVGADRAHHAVYPAPADTFAALERTPLRDVRAVILGQDPYHGEGQADGLAFSVHPDAKHRPAGRKIRQLLCNDLGLQDSDLPPHGNLAGWAMQGVLLLNTALTVRGADPAGRDHMRRWQPFADAVIAAINSKPEPVVFMLWGGKAQAKSSLITGRHHSIVEAAHPTHWSNVTEQFIESKAFTRANAALAGPPIAWERTG
jgi:uracil-DNA glycosylase